MVKDKDKDKENIKIKKASQSKLFYFVTTFKNRYLCSYAVFVCARDTTK